MNLGFGDGIALAHAVSAHIKSQESEVLTTYSRSRLDKARYVIHLASRTFKGYQWMMNTYPFLRRVLAFILNHVKFLQSKLILKVSGLDTARRP
jgi:2-polyprenyl-6-methoxyphenol hydroxylase-like FAD-dependent oxidoreductase